MNLLTPEEIVRLAQETVKTGDRSEVKMSVIRATGLDPSKTPTKEEFQVFARNFDCVNICIVMPYMIPSEMYSA